MIHYGLIGKKLGHSFSKTFFTEKFKDGNIDAVYENYELSAASELPALIKKNRTLRGLNVTVPFKEEIIPFLDEIEETAKEIGAINTITIVSGKSKGFNTDAGGFSRALKEFLGGLTTQKVLVLGNGGSSKAVQYALRKDFHCDDVTVVSRQPSGKSIISWKDLNADLVAEYSLIVNTTPLGMFPAVQEFPPFPFEGFRKGQFVFDLIYNPLRTEFLKQAKDSGCRIENGMNMLKYQAALAWQIWRFAPKPTRTVGVKKVKA